MEVSRNETFTYKRKNTLYKHTDLETTFGMNMVAIARGKPVQMGLMEIIKHYVNYQKEVVLRRTRFELNQAKERCHILEGLIVAVRNIDEVIQIIKRRNPLRTRAISSAHVSAFRKNRRRQFSICALPA